MKRTIFVVTTLALSLLFQWVIISPASAMDGNKPIVKEIKASRFTSITINADVTVILLNSFDETIQIEGYDILIRDINITQKGNSLVINAARNRDYKKKGIIYIPAGVLRYMEINSAALVKSAETLEIPQLDVLINGVCQLNIANRGTLKLNGSAYYAVDYVMRDARFPFVVLDKQENY